MSLALETLAQSTVPTGEVVTFWILAPIALACALGMVLARNAVHSALFLVVTMLCLGVFYMVQAGPFLGFVQIIVYTGAIMMLFLFVLMLVGRDSAEAVIEVLRGQRIAAVVLGGGLAALLGTGAVRALRATTATGLEAANADGNVQAIAQLLFTRYVFAFEVTSALLITAAVGAMVLAHVTRPKAERVGQTARMLARFAPGGSPAPKPGPGVFATSNSIATPALLPDGTPAERSISAVVPTRDLTPEEAAPKGTQGNQEGQQ
ncbi:MAG: NADH-quinone oxidoreductase subunit J [Dactylosporangium sp.]|nr:NADH-quinone oxidoreductase subunit J [Dactylosporangium sp.]NNJ60079.1 NADH-quinone oxidoreductase subunit J [Dactylosporangium sp.]